MSVTEFQSWILKYKKHLSVFVALCVLLCYIYVEAKQSYTAEVYIKYIGNNASYGYSADGSPLDPHEIHSAHVVKNALLSIGENDDNCAQISSNITVTPIVSTSEEEKYASWIESFSDYEDTEENKPTPVYYKVKFKTDKGETYAEKVLNAVVNEYRKYYYDKYDGANDVVKLSDEAILEYDYFITADILEKKIDSNVEYLQTVVANDTNYRSAVTGYSLNDLIGEYRILKERALACVSREILENGISKNSSLLVTSLHNSADFAQLESNNELNKATTEKELLEVYSEKNKEYMWSVDDTASDEGRDQVRADTERDHRYNRDETTYDGMMLKYVDYASNGEDLLIDKANYLDYMTYFNTISTENTSVEDTLRQICDDFNAIHTITEQTVKDYNNTKSSYHIAMISGVSTGETMGTLIYYVAAIIFALGMGIVVIIFIELKNKKKI